MFNSSVESAQVLQGLQLSLLAKMFSEYLVINTVFILESSQCLDGHRDFFPKNFVLHPTVCKVIFLPFFVLFSHLVFLLHHQSLVHHYFVLHTATVIASGRLKKMSFFFPQCIILPFDLDSVNRMSYNVDCAKSVLFL